MDAFIANLSKEELTRLINVFDIQIAIVIVVVAIFTQNIVAKILVSIFDKIQRRKERPTDSGMYRTVKFMYVFLAIYLGSKILPSSNRIDIIMGSFLKSAIVLFMASLINNTIFVKDSKFFKPRRGSSETVFTFVCKIARVIVWIVAFYIIVRVILGFKQLDGLVTGLGIGTVVLSFAAQDTVKSLFSGFAILTDKPFVIGDWIECGVYAGTVVDITFRSTRIKGVDQSIVTIPNSTITAEYVKNWAKLKMRRFDCTLNLAMEDLDPDKIKKIIKNLKTVILSKDYIKEDSVYVGFNGIAESGYAIKIFANILEIDYKENLKRQEDLYCEFIKVLNKENVHLAYPTQTIHIANNNVTKK